MAVSAEGAFAAGEQAGKTQAAPAAGGRRGSGERVLVCDDDPQIRRALRLVLADAGYTVLMTENGEQALDRAALARPHAAIVDLMLPDVHGIEVCRRLREWSDLPILVLSAIDEEAIKIEALERGADDYVTKPFAPGELVARVQAALRRARHDVTEPRIEVDGLVVDVAAHAVWLDGQEVHLTPIEFSLLRVLATNRGLLLTHRHLLEEVWGPQYTDATPLLRTHIANLRGKLQRAGQDPSLIRTDAGIGYRLTG
jgi:two-component system, OmpR family, KDP operon response regulator KdpE